MKGLKSPSLVSIVVSFFLLFLGVLLAFQWLDQPISATNRYFLSNPFSRTTASSHNLVACPRKEHGPVVCANTTTAAELRQFPPGPACPDYFRWIHEDLRPWNQSGITREMVESGKKLADFRLVIVGGKAYLETYRKSFQTRDLFTIWGILQLLILYPGRIPDLDLMFNCGDVPRVPAADYRPYKGLPPPPVFHYCADEASQDIVFPDWSFWGCRSARLSLPMERRRHPRSTPPTECCRRSPEPSSSFSRLVSSAHDHFGFHLSPAPPLCSVSTTPAYGAAAAARPRSTPPLSLHWSERTSRNCLMTRMCKMYYCSLQHL